MHVIIRLTVISFNPFGISLCTANNQHESHTISAEEGKKKSEIETICYKKKLILNKKKINNNKMQKIYNKHHKTSVEEGFNRV